MRQWIESHFSIMLFIGVAAGLFVPYLEQLPSITPVILVASVMFFSCSKITLHQLPTHNNIIHFLFFYVLRFIVLPIALYHIATILTPTYAIGILLVSLMPLGAASTAIAGMTGGNPTLTLIATIFTNALAPFLVPLLIMLVSGENINLRSDALFFTLAGCIFFPAIAYATIKKVVPSSQPWIKHYAQVMITLLLSGMVASVVAYRRDYFFLNGMHSLFIFAYACGLYMLFYALGWCYGLGKPLALRRTYAISSGVNNIALSAALAVLYFSTDTVVFTVLGEIAWVVAISAFKRASHMKQ
jgi:predicted Na+-dependent transporter